MNVERPGAKRYSSWLCGFLCVVAISTKAASGAEFRLEPLIEVQEEYNSNIFLSQTNEQADYITSLNPAINAIYRASLWDWDLSFRHIERYYATTGFGKDRTSYLSLNNTTRIVDERIGILMNDQYSRVSLDISRDYTQESTFINQTESNVFSINPFFATRAREQMTVTFGYTYRNTWYKDPSAIDTVDHVGSIDARYEMTSKLALNWVFRHSQSVNRIQDYRREELVGGFRHEYTDGSFLSVNVGINYFDVDQAGESWQQVGDAGISHRWPSTTTSVAVGRQFTPAPLTVLRREDRALGTVTLQGERTSVQINGEVRRFTGVLTDTLQNANYQGVLTLTYSLTTQTRLSLTGSRDHNESFNPHTSSLILQRRLRIEEQPSGRLTAGLEFRYSTSTSHDTAGTNYQDVRVMADMQYQF